MLTPQSLPSIQNAISESGVDGWLIFDFHGLNPIAAGMLRLEGMTTRRLFAFIPSEGQPIAISHAIEQGPWKHWPAEWKKVEYSGWRVLESTLADIVGGKRVAMEYSAGDAVPYLDRVPAGVIEMVRAAGATVASSADLVTRFYAVWNPEQLASHQRAAETIARIAHEAMALAGERSKAGSPMKEYELHRWILDEFAKEGLETDHGPIVAIGPNAANAHYEPTAGESASIDRGAILLIDLWAREPGGVYADQTWMGSLGDPDEKSLKVWEAIRDARDAAVALLRERIGSSAPVRGGEVDDAARAVIEQRGFGPQFIHRTGHSIDPRDLHGSGPHIDNLETREERTLLPGVGFSIEPGIYIKAEVGMRTELNAFIGSELIVTPAEIQRDLIIV
ncbi:MAG: aminopeptidase P family protein [Gemmatimonadaceae bacterium]|nr:aminopeptidase P family protein [Gemmatimonadaceae bacterium]